MILSSIIILETLRKCYSIFKQYQIGKYHSILPRYSEDSEILLKKMDKLKKSTETQSTKSKRLNTNTTDMSQVNTYDMFKLISTIAMFVDHYGYFGLPGLNWEQRGWARIIGRFAAPGFFFLAGYASKRFRLRTWMAAFFLYFFTTVAPLGIVHSPWESIMNIAFINCLFELIPPHKLLAMRPIMCIKHASIYVSILINIAVFGFLFYIRDYCSTDLGIGYGTLPYMLAIAGDLHRHKNKLSKMWIVGSMATFFYASNSVFANNFWHTVGIAVACLLNGIIMMMFKVQSIPGMDKNFVLKSAQNGIKWISREGLTVYVGHLMLYRLIATMQYTWKTKYL